MNGFGARRLCYDTKGEAADKAERDDPKSARYRRLWRAKARKDWSVNSVV